LIALNTFPVFEIVESFHSDCANSNQSEYITLAVPAAPAGPVAPAAPAEPAGPAGPVAPAGPAGPTGPSLTQLNINSEIEIKMYNKDDFIIIEIYIKTIDFENCLNYKTKIIFNEQ
jgi:hypothetical protein